jgi:multiple sugar transport system substrate-binding protein
MINFAPSRRQFLAGAGAVAASVALAGCGKRRPDKDAAGRTILYYYSYAGDGFDSFYRDYLFPAFRAAHPEIVLDVTLAAGDAGYDSKLLTLIAGGMPPDLIHVTQQNFPFYAAKDVLLPLESLIAEDTEFKIDDYFPRVMEGMRVGGKLLGLPSDFSTVLMVYNVDLFDELKIERPAPNWTWGDYLDIAHKLVKMPDRYGTANPSSYNRWPAWVWMNGGNVFNADMTQCTMDSPEAIAGLKYYVELSTREGVAAMSGQTMGMTEMQMFAGRRIGVYGGARYAYKSFMRGRSELKFKWDVSHMPTGPVTRASTYIWGGNCILKSTTKPREAWKLIKFMSDARGGQLSFDAGNALPPHRPTAERNVARRDNPNIPEHDAYFIDAVEYSRQAPFPTNYAEFTSAQTGIADAFLDLTPVDVACREFAKETNQILARERAAKKALNVVKSA